MTSSRGEVGSADSVIDRQRASREIICSLPVGQSQLAGVGPSARRLRSSDRPGRAGPGRASKTRPAHRLRSLRRMMMAVCVTVYDVMAAVCHSDTTGPKL